jgi:hypothetical protein
MRRACARKLFLWQLRVTTDPFSASVTVASKPGGRPSRSVSPAPLGFASPGHSPSGARPHLWVATHLTLPLHRRRFAALACPNGGGPSRFAITEQQPRLYLPHWARSASGARRVGAHRRNYRSLRVLVPHPTTLAALRWSTSPEGGGMEADSPPQSPLLLAGRSRSCPGADRIPISPSGRIAKGRRARRSQH